MIPERQNIRIIEPGQPIGQISILGHPLSFRENLNAGKEQQNYHNVIGGNELSILTIFPQRKTHSLKIDRG